MKIYIISPTYPSAGHPVNTFIKQIVDEWADQGHQCEVVAPFSVTKSHWKAPKEEVQVTEKGNKVLIHRPHYVSVSNLKIFGISVSTWLRNRAFNRVLKKLPPDADAMYGHFWHNAVGGYAYAKRHDIPFFVACGESTIGQEWTEEKNKPFVDYVKGIVCVSTKNKDALIDMGMATTDKCVVLPNAYNPKKFGKLDRTECRKKLNLPEDAFIIAFVGTLCHRKGTKRVSEAIKHCKGRPVYSIFIGGEGGETPDCENILYRGMVQHEELKYYLNAADCFVLPTLAEGCSNAVIEALACGMAIISSDLPFNHDVLNRDNAILIDPSDVDAITTAIERLRDDEALRDTLGRKALEKAQILTVENRARAIIEFMETKIQNN